MRFKFPKDAKEWKEKGEHFFHMTYLGMVSFEGHGYYRIAAAVLFCITASGVFITHKMEDEDEEEGND